MKMVAELVMIMVVKYYKELDQELEVQEISGFVHSYSTRSSNGTNLCCVHVAELQPKLKQPTLHHVANMWTSITMHTISIKGRGGGEEAASAL